MGLFNKSVKQKRHKGLIGYFGLSEWWESEFSDEEKVKILKTYQPLGMSGPESLLYYNIYESSHSELKFLTILSGWFDNQNDRNIARKIITKAGEFANDSGNILDLHFYYLAQININYKERESSSEALNQAIEFCKKQIEIAPGVKEAMIKEYNDGFLPSHSGFKQLAIIEEKNGNYNSAIELSTEALNQGWNGDWEKRIERCKRKLIQ